MFGQVVLGPPGSGKSTYCTGVCQFLNSVGRRTVIVNLDPANDVLPYECAVSVCDLIQLQDVADAYCLGPNGGLVYCMEFLERNLDWLLEQLAPFEGAYFLFDFPGQAELYTHHSSVTNILHTLLKHDYRLTAVHLVDSHHCSDGAKFISACLLSLSTLIKLELPTVNVLSKADLLPATAHTRPFDVDFYTDLTNLCELLPTVPGFPGFDDELQELEQEPSEGPLTVSASARVRATRFFSKHHKLHAALCDVITSYSLVAFHTLAIEDRESVERLTKVIDTANGYKYSDTKAKK